MTLEAEPLLTPAEVAALFGVDAKTVTRWAQAGRLQSIRTLGGHRRYRESEIRALLGTVETPTSTSVTLTCKGDPWCDRKVVGSSLADARRIASIHRWVDDCCPAHRPRAQASHDGQPGGGLAVNNNRGGRP